MLFLFMLLVSVVGCFVEWVEELCVNYMKNGLTFVDDENGVLEWSRRGLGSSWGTLGDSRWAQEWILMDLWSILGSLSEVF